MSVILNGTSQYLTGAIVVPQNEGTLSVWVKGVIGTLTGVLMDSDGFRNQCFLDTVVGKEFYAYFDGYNPKRNRNGLGGANTWHHTAWCYKKTGPVFNSYIDGSALTVDSDAGTWGATGGTTQVTFGARYSQDSSFYGGRMAELAIYDQLLTALEVADLAAGDSPQAVQAAHLALYYRLNTNLAPTVGSVTLTNGGGATFDGADNPVVDNPPGGGGGDVLSGIARRMRYRSLFPILAVLNAINIYGPAAR